jgi:hypothetical protein
MYPYPQGRYGLQKWLSFCRIAEGSCEGFADGR